MCRIWILEDKAELAERMKIELAEEPTCDVVAVTHKLDDAEADVARGLLDEIDIVVADFLLEVGQEAQMFAFLDTMGRTRKDIRILVVSAAKFAIRERIRKFCKRRDLPVLWRPYKPRDLLKAVRRLQRSSPGGP